MNSSESATAVTHIVQRLGYPSRVDRKDLWTKPRAALGIAKPDSDCIEVVNWQGFPRAVVACGLQPRIVLDYVMGPAFSQPPPAAFVFDGSGNVMAFRHDGSDFHATSNPPIWEQTLSDPAGCISALQATKVIEEVAEGNRKWFQNFRSKKIVGVLPRIFPEGTVVLYELLQNAADSGASEVAFSLESKTLLFLHDGFPFTENDVDAISFVNSSTKPPENIGFMGIGFKAVFEISDQPEIHSPPLCFGFDRNQEGGELFPIPLNCTHTSLGNYSTFFRFPLKEEATSLIANELERFDGGPLLYIGADLRRIKTPNGDFHLHNVHQIGEINVLEVSDSATQSRTEYAVFSKELKPSPAALQEFAINRKLELSRYEGRKQRVSIAISLDSGIPYAARSGRLQVYLPTDVRLPLSFDVQGNFLVGASRKELRHASGPWNREHFRTLPLLVADVLEWSKSEAASTSRWASWYDLIPDWQELEEHLGLHHVDGTGSLSEVNLQSAFAAELSKRELIPAIDNRGSLVFVAPQDAILVDQDLEEVLPVRDLARLSNSKVLSPSLSEKAKVSLAGYVEQFGPVEFKASLEESGWIRHVEALSRSTVSKRAKHQIAKILAYLERECGHFPSGLGKCKVVLTQDGNLRAAEEKDARKVYTLPDVDITFPAAELAVHYDVVHQGFRRDLNRPGEMNLEMGITRDAVKTLERVAPTLGPRQIATDIILPLFQTNRWQDVPDERLLRYTRFLMQHYRHAKATINASQLKVKIRGASRQYLPPDQVYFGGEYSLDGERFDRLCASSEGVYFLSDDYLRKVGGAKEDWARFFAELGVTAYPRIRTTTSQILKGAMGELLRLTEEVQLPNSDLRAGDIYDTKESSFIKGSHYALDDLVLDYSIQESIQMLYTVKAPGWKDRLADFAFLLEAGWAEYKSKLYKRLRYSLYHSSFIERKTVSAPSSFAKFLRQKPWLPVLDDPSASRRSSDLVLNTVENRAYAGNDSPLSYCTFEEPNLISFLDIQIHPPESTPLRRLQYAVQRKEDDRDILDNLYADLAGSPDLDTNALRVEFQDNPLIFAPDHDPSYVTSMEALYASRTSLAPRIAAIKDTYPNLEQFFADSLGIPTTESLGHFVEFLRDYVWKSCPPITDNLRSAVESCYRRFFNHLNETQDEAREEALALLKEQLGSPTMVFCGTLGWVDTTKTMVLYADTAAYEGWLSDQHGIAMESHLKRLAQPLSEIRMLLDALNVKPISEAIHRVPDIGDVGLHPRSVAIGGRLSLIVRKVVAIVEREQANTESNNRNVALFLQEWRDRAELLFSDIHFYQSPSIKVRYELVSDNTLLREMRERAYVSAQTDQLKIYMSGDLLEVFDAIADQLRGILRLDLLPASLRDDITSLVQSNLAGLENQQFGIFLNRRLREKGFPVEEDEELKRILESATRNAEAEAQSDRAEDARGAESASDSHFTSTRDRRDSNSGPSEGLTQPQPEALTAREILDKLPKFDETSYGRDNVIDLTGTSRWQIRTQGSGFDRRGSGSSGGVPSFRNIQAYRDAYGIRGEQWVAERERQSLTEIGKPDLAERVVHRSTIREGSPWDIESFEKYYPYRPIYVEVKSTSKPDNFDVDMSVDQIRAALESSSPYYIYRVVNVHTSKPTVYIFDFKAISQEIKFSATNVSVLLPKPTNPNP